MNRDTRLIKLSWRAVGLPLLVVFALCLSVWSAETGREVQFVAEAAREIPVIKQVDVLVVGGSSAGVAAAAKAADAGADVFLAAERPYLGQDICRTYEMWVPDAASTELAKRVFGEVEAGAGVEADYEYTMSAESAPAHAETDPPTRLKDGEFSDAGRHSVQYTYDVAVKVDLKKVQSVQSVHLFAFQRQGDFVVEQFELAGSMDGTKWTPRAVAVNAKSGTDADRVELIAAEQFEARYLQLKVRKKMPCKRILLGELKVFVKGDASGGRPPLRPFEVKAALEQILMKSRVDFLFGCYPTEVLKDVDGNLKGVVFSNRSGRQAVLAKKIVDASAFASVARIAGAEFKPFEPGEKKFEYITAGGAGSTELPSKNIEENVDGKFPARRYCTSKMMCDDTYPEMMGALHAVARAAWAKGMVENSGMLIYQPENRVKSSVKERFRSSSFENLYVLSRYSDDPVSGGCIGLFEKGEELGTAVGEAAKHVPGIKKEELSVFNGSAASGSQVQGELREFLGGPRSFKQKFPMLKTDGLNVPVIGEYDVVVVGGGTAGAPAGIGAAKRGARTLVIEYLDGLGGVGTSGMIGRYCLGVRNGFTEVVDRGMADLAGTPYVQDTAGMTTPWDIELKKEWLRRELISSGADVWFGTAGCGVLMEGNRVTGVVVATPYGRGVVKAGAVVDATGSSDVAVTAGAEPMYIDADNIEIQGNGLSPRQLGAGYINTDYDFVNDNDMVDVWRMHVSAKHMFENATGKPFERFRSSYDIAQLINTRERRRMVGEFTISPVDIFNGRTYSDTVSRAYSNFDTHGYATHPLFFTLWPPHGMLVYANVPYRAMLPQGVEGVVVTGIGISAHRDALPVLRMQADVQNNGYAAGLAAAQAVANGQLPSQIDIKPVQKKMTELGAFDHFDVDRRTAAISFENGPGALEETDNFPLPDSRLLDAAKNLDATYNGAAVLFTDPERSVRFLKAEYEATADPDKKLACANLLGMFGDDTGVDLLIQAVESMPWDAGWNWTVSGQFESTVSRLDSYIIALGYAGNLKAVDAIARKAEQLDDTSDFSHYLAVSMACNSLRDGRLAPVLCRLVRSDHISGYELTDKFDVYAYADRSEGKESIRNEVLKEILLARALYRCGDFEGIGEYTLKKYSMDLRGIFAKCATEVLREGK